MLKRSRPDGATSPAKDLSAVLDEQATLIASLKKDKTNLEGEVSTLKEDNGRITKENQLLRRAVAIQQDRQTQTEKELKDAQEFRVGAEEQMRKLEQVILTLRYHLQAQHSNYGNNFMERPPPDVF